MNQQEYHSYACKEGAADYRCFPEPDLPLFEISDEWIENAYGLPEFQKTVGLFPWQSGLSDYDASQLTAAKSLLTSLKRCGHGGDAKQV